MKRYSKAQIELAKKRQNLKTDEAALYVLDYNTRMAERMWKRRRNIARAKRNREIEASSKIYYWELNQTR
jgi:hypothetical protein